MVQKLTDAQRRDWLRLARTENVGPVTFEQLIGRYGEAAVALAALPELARRGGRAGLKITREADAEAELAAGEALGARLICACEPDYPQALAALDRESVDVVLLDLNMPGMRGEEVVARIPQDGPQVVFLTGAGADVVGSALLSGPHYYLPKGASRGELSLLLDSLHA